MATKTSSKTATRKPAGSAAGRKPTAHQERADVQQKPKLAKKGPAASAELRELKSPPEKADVSGQPIPHPETVSLIDRKRPAKRTQEGEVRPKRAVLPPISRIRASLETTSKPSPPAHAPSPEPAAEQSPSADVTPAPSEAEAGPQ